MQDDQALPRFRYSEPEIERRWLVDLDQVGPLFEGQAVLIQDLYVTGTRLRLRRMVRPDGNATLKFGKKYGKTSPLSEPITNLYLSAAEYEALSVLTGAVIRKKRYTVAGGSLDVHLEPHEGLALFEKEFASEREALNYAPPPFVLEEVTANERYRGAALANRGPESTDE